MSGSASFFDCFATSFHSLLGSVVDSPSLYPSLESRRVRTYAGRAQRITGVLFQVLRLNHSARLPFLCWWWESEKHIIITKLLQKVGKFSRNFRPEGDGFCGKNELSNSHDRLSFNSRSLIIIFPPSSNLRAIV
jgi:hypothetical protein